MTLDQMRYFIAAAEELNLSKAADRLFVNHSSVSRGITAMEEELGVMLLIRTRKSVTLTEAGEHCYQKSRSILEQIDSLQIELERISMSGKLKIGTISGLPMQYFSLFNQFSQLYPQFSLNYSQEAPWALLRGLRSGTYDICLTFSYTLMSDKNLQDEIAAYQLQRGQYQLFMTEASYQKDSQFTTFDAMLENRKVHSSGVVKCMSLEELKKDYIRRMTNGEDSPLDEIEFKIKSENYVALLPDFLLDSFGAGCVAIPLPKEKQFEYHLVLIFQQSNKNTPLLTFKKFLSTQGKLVSFVRP